MAPGAGAGDGVEIVRRCEAAGIEDITILPSVAQVPDLDLGVETVTHRLTPAGPASVPTCSVDPRS